MNLHPTFWRCAKVAVIALWREGWATRLRINVWIVVLLMLFLGGAGGGIFIASKFAPLGYYDPRLLVLMLGCWTMLATAGWVFTITTAKSPPGMALSSLLMLVSLIVLAMQGKGY